MPLVPDMLPLSDAVRLPVSTLFTMVALFSVGAARASVTLDRWWRAGLEGSLALGGVVALAAYGAAAIATEGSRLAAPNRF